MPSIGGTDVEAIEEKLEQRKVAHYRNEYKVKFADGGWIHIEYASKDMCRSYLVRPDRSVIDVTCSDASLGLTDSWNKEN